MNMNRLADANRRETGSRLGLADLAGSDNVQESSDWGNNAGALNTHPSLFGQTPLYPGLLQRRPRAGASATPPVNPDQNLQLDGELVDSLQLDGEGAGDRSAAIHQKAAEGISGSAGQLPHMDAIQKSFGRHSVDDIQAHTDDKARSANQAMGANAYATGSHVALDDTSLHTVAHEAAHVVQQRGGGVQLQNGVGKAGDQYEQHADAVADLVVQGKSAEHLLDQYSGGKSSDSVQKSENEQEPESATAQSDDDNQSASSSSENAVSAKQSSSAGGLLQHSKNEEEAEEEAPASSADDNVISAKQSSSSFGLLQMDGSDQKKDDGNDSSDDEQKKEDAPSSASATTEEGPVSAKASPSGHGLLQLDDAKSDDASSAKKKPPVKPAQALAQVKSAPSNTPAEAPAAEVKTGAGAEAAIVRPMMEENPESAASEAPSATADAKEAPTQTKSKGVQLDNKKGSTPEKSKVGFTPPKMVWNGLTFDGIEGDVNREFYKSEFPKRKLFKVGHYWPFPAFPFAGIDTAAGADIQPEIAVVAKGKYKWNPLEKKYEFSGQFETSAAVTLTIWARGGLAINLVIQSGGVGLEASSSIEAKAAATAEAGFKIDGKTGAMEGNVGASLDISAQWKAALAMAVWTEGWFYDDVWKYTFAEWTIGTLTGFKLKAGWQSGQGFAWGVDPSSGSFNWGAAPENPQK